MPSLNDYFSKNRYKPKWFLGDRVEGKWNNIPFVGTVAIDSKIFENIEPRVVVFVDLPILHDGTIYSIITTNVKSLKARK